MPSVFTRFMIAVVTAAITWYVFYELARYFERPDAIFIATVLLGSVFLHEMGHLLAFKRHGVSSIMFFAVVLGGVGPLGKRHKRLHDSANAEIALAGMAGNIVAAFIGVVLGAFGLITWSDALRVVNVNAALMTFNLIPFGSLDGGRMAKILFNSITEERDAVYVRCMISVVVAALLVTVAIGNTQFLPAFLFIYGFRKRAADDDELGSMKPKALDARQQCFWARTYVFLAAFSLIVLAATPSWI